MPARVPTPADAPPLIFQWKRERGVKRRLAMWVLLVAAGHAALFYLFRVAPPLASRQPPPQQAMLYLPPAEPGVRDLFSALEDRFPGSVLRGEDYNLKADLAALAKVTPRPVPSWDAHRAVLKPFPQPVVPQELPALVQPGEILLPEGDAPPLPAAPANGGGKPAPFVVVEGGAEGRTIVRPPIWPEKLTDWPASGNIPFMVSVARNGHPLYCMALSPASGMDLEALRSILMGMRFSETLSGGPEWVTVAVRW